MKRQQKIGVFTQDGKIRLVLTGFRKDSMTPQIIECSDRDEVTFRLLALRTLSDEEIVRRITTKGN